MRAARLALGPLLGLTAACDGSDLSAATSTTTILVTTTVPPTLAPTVPPPTAAATPPPLPQLDLALVLEGSEWQLDAVIFTEDAEAVPRDMPDPTISFEGGVVTVYTGCNTDAAAFTTIGDQITFEPLSLSEDDCDALASNIERSIVHVLQDTATVRFDNGILNILRDGAQLVYFPD